MREEEYWADELTPWQSSLYGMDFADALLKCELGVDIEPIHVREFHGTVYVLDGHHRVSAAMVYNLHLDAFVVEKFEDCDHYDQDISFILQRQYIYVEKNQGLLAAPSFESMILCAYEETLLYIERTAHDSDIVDAMQRASGKLEEWVG